MKHDPRSQQFRVASAEDDRDALGESRAEATKTHRTSDGLTPLLDFVVEVAHGCFVEQRARIEDVRTAFVGGVVGVFVCLDRSAHDQRRGVGLDRFTFGLGDVHRGVVSDSGHDERRLGGWLRQHRKAESPVRRGQGVQQSPEMSVRVVPRYAACSNRHIINAITTMTNGQESAGSDFFVGMSC